MHLHIDIDLTAFVASLKRNTPVFIESVARMYAAGMTIMSKNANYEANQAAVDMDEGASMMLKAAEAAEMAADSYNKEKWTKDREEAGKSTGGRRRKGKMRQVIDIFTRQPLGEVPPPEKT